MFYVMRQEAFSTSFFIIFLYTGGCWKGGRGGGRRGEGEGEGGGGAMPPIKKRIIDSS